MINLGIQKPGSTLIIPWDTFAASTGASITSTGIAVTDVEIYKDSSMTQRASDAGYTLLDTDGIDLDTVTGIQGLSINLADNTDAGFYASGSLYRVVIASVTIDGQTVNFTPVVFEIGYPSAVLNTTIATLSSQTSFTLTSGPAEDDAINDMWVVIHDVASAVQWGKAIVSDYTGSTKTVTLAAGTTFTAAATDNISVMGPMPLQPVTAGRKPVVDAAGLVDANTVKVGPTGAGTAQTARDIGANVLLSSGTGTGQLDVTSGVAKANVTQLLGTAWLTPAVAGTPDVNAKQIGGTAQAAQDLYTRMREFVRAIVRADVSLPAEIAGTYDPATQSLEAFYGNALTAIDINTALLKMDWTGITGEALHSVLNAMRFILNEWDMTTSPGYLTVMKEDESTPAFKKAVVSDAAAEPIISVDGPITP